MLGDSTGRRLLKLVPGFLQTLSPCAFAHCRVCLVSFCCESYGHEYVLSPPRAMEPGPGCGDL